MTDKLSYEELGRKAGKTKQERPQEGPPPAGRQAPQAHRLSEVALLDNLKKSFLFYTHDTAGNLNYVSPNINMILGYSQEEFTENFKSYLTDNPLNSQYLKIMAEPNPEKLFHEIEIRHKNGETFWLEAKDIPVVDAHGKFVSVEVVVHDITRRKKMEIEREKLISELKQALHEIKTLRGIIPICSFCKKIRDDMGAWNRLEKYVSEHTEAKFSHGVCPGCAVKHYPEMFEDDD